jgi:hypothetical protein
VFALSLKTTAVLVVLAVLLGVYVGFFRDTKPPETPELGPEVWSVQEDALERIEIVSGQRVAFRKGNQGSWRFDEPEGSEVDPKRWGGVPLLVTGPASKRVIAQKPGDLAEYGLETPRMEILLGLHGGKSLRILVGDKTPDETNCYVKVAGWDPVYTVDSSWAQVLSRLVTEPPRLAPANRPQDEVVPRSAGGAGAARPTDSTRK